MAEHDLDNVRIRLSPAVTYQLRQLAPTLGITVRDLAVLLIEQRLRQMSKADIWISWPEHTRMVCDALAAAQLAGGPDES